MIVVFISVLIYLKDPPVLPPRGEIAKHVDFANVWFVAQVLIGFKLKNIICPVNVQKVLHDYKFQKVLHDYQYNLHV